MNNEIINGIKCYIQEGYDLIKSGTCDGAYSVSCYMQAYNNFFEAPRYNIGRAAYWLFYAQITIDNGYDIPPETIDDIKEAIKFVKDKDDKQFLKVAIAAEKLINNSIH